MQQHELLNDMPICLFKDQKAWQDWLHIYADSQPKGVWLKIAKKDTGATSVTYAEALDIALCYGWIDGQIKRYSDQYYIQKFTPRRVKSIWSRRNVVRAEELIHEGRMQPSGLVAIKAAQQDGRWEAAYDSSANIVVPPDFQVELTAHPIAAQFFDGLSKTNRYAVLWRIQTARTPAARQKTIQKLVVMLQEEKTFH